MFLRLIYLKLNFSHLQNNCWHTDWCQEWNIKTSLLKSIKIAHDLAFWRVLSSPFQSTANCFVALMTSTPYQSDLRISDHRGHKFPPSLTLLSFKTRIQWPAVLIPTANFPAYFYNSCNIQGNVQAIQLTGPLWWQNLPLFFQHFLQDL